MSEQFTLGVNGAAGRMGQRVVALAMQDPTFILSAALESPKCPKLGADAGELAGIGRIDLPLAAELERRVDVIIDFSMPEGTAAIAQVCAKRQIPLVVATTGLEGTVKDTVLSAAQVTPVLLSPSMSPAVNLTMKLVREAARILKNIPEGVDVEIVERHHRFKEDAPSGTALKFGQIVAGEMELTEHVHGRHGRIGARKRSEIGYHALRTGDNVGEHTIIFGLLGETLELSVKSSTRDAYAYGALAAAKVLVTKKAGLYSMDDVLGL
jgi:4-hydroxy-tetrahydrodipicolinate reductase